MSKSWIITWVEHEISELTDAKKPKLFMIHTFSLTYARNLIKYLEVNNCIHNWCRVEGLLLRVTGDVVGHLKSTSKVLSEVFGE